MNIEILLTMKPGSHITLNEEVFKIQSTPTAIKKHFDMVYVCSYRVCIVIVGVRSQRIAFLHHMALTRLLLREMLWYTFV